MQSLVARSGGGSRIGCCGARGDHPREGHEFCLRWRIGTQPFVAAGVSRREGSRRFRKWASGNLPPLSRSYAVKGDEFPVCESEAAVRNSGRVMSVLVVLSAIQSRIDRLSYDIADSLTSAASRWVVVVFLASSLFLQASPSHASALPSVAGNAPAAMGFSISERDLQVSDDFSTRVSSAVELLEKGQHAQARGDFLVALDYFNQVTKTAGDLALAEYARVGHAVTLYEVGDRSEAIVEMEDVSISLKGYPEIHAALAAALYADKNAAMPAERQFTIATLLDPRYTDLKWVQETKHWPPSLINSLQRFISLQ